MRRMWLWVLLYAIGAGIIMLVTSLTLSLGTSEAGYPSVEIVGVIGIVLTFLAALGGFWVLFAGFILLLRRGKFAEGRVVSLIGIWVYYVGAFGIVLASSLIWFYSEFSLEILWALFYYFIAVVVGLPGAFIMRKLNRLQAESTET